MAQMTTNVAMVACVAALVAGCAAPKVQPPFDPPPAVTVSQLGGNTYQVNTQSYSAYKAKVAALEAAKRTCTDAQREVLITNIEEHLVPMTTGKAAAVTFQCRNHGDPALLNPTYTTPPSAVIDDRR
jgi:hypothetical protein